MFAVVLASIVFILILVDEWRCHKNGAGIEHMHTATAACSNGRHWNCSGTVHYFTKRGTTPCSCPICH